MLPTTLGIILFMEHLSVSRDLEDSGRAGSEVGGGEVRGLSFRMKGKLKTEIPDQVIGGLLAVAARSVSVRITPVWSVKKYRRPVVPGALGLAVIVYPKVFTPPDSALNGS